MELKNDEIFKMASLILGGMGVALALAYIFAQLPRWLGSRRADLDDKYFVVDFSGTLLVIAIGCFAAAVIIWLARTHISRIF